MYVQRVEGERLEYKYTWVLGWCAEWQGGVGHPDKWDIPRNWACCYWESAVGRADWLNITPALFSSQLDCSQASYRTRWLNSTTKQINGTLSEAEATLIRPSISRQESQHDECDRVHWWMGTERAVASIIRPALATSNTTKCDRRDPSSQAHVRLLASVANY